MCKPRLKRLLIRPSTTTCDLKFVYFDFSLETLFCFLLCTYTYYIYPNYIIDCVSEGLYQWTPIVLAIQALCCFLPYMFWTAMQQRAGINLKSIVSAVKKGNSSLDLEDRNKIIEFAARLVDECLLMQREYRSWCTFEFRHCLGRIMPCFVGKLSGNLLTIGYLLFKLLFVALPIAQIWFMSRYIGVLLSPIISFIPP